MASKILHPVHQYLLYTRELQMILQHEIVLLNYNFIWFNFLNNLDTDNVSVMSP